MQSAVAAVSPSHSLKHRVVRSALGGFLNSILANGFLFIGGQLLIPRILSVPQYAEFTVSISFVALLALIADLGLTPMLVREFARANAADGSIDRGTLLGSALALRLALSAVVGIAVLALGPLLYNSSMVANMAIVLMSLVISSRILIVRSVGEALVRSLGKYQISSFFALIDAIAFATVLFVARTSALSVSNVLWIYVLCNIPGFLLLSVWIARWMRREDVRLRVSAGTAWRFLLLGAPLSIATAFWTVHVQADPLLLDRLSTSTQVANFAVMLRLSAAVSPIPLVLSGVLAPEITRLYASSDHARIARLIRVSLKVLLMIAGGIALFLLPSSQQIAGLALGEKYVAAAPLLGLVGWMLVPIFIATFMSEVSIAVGRFWPVTVYNGFIMVAVIVGDVLLIGPYGAEGAMISKLVAVAAGCVLLFLLFRRAPYFRTADSLKDIIRVAVAAGAALFLGHTTLLTASTPLVGSLLVVGSYLAVLVLTRAIELREVTEFLTHLRRS